MTKELPHNVVLKEYHDGNWYVTRGWEDDTELLKRDGTWVLVDDLPEKMDEVQPIAAFDTREESAAAAITAGEPKFTVETYEERHDPLRELRKLLDAIR